LRSFPEAVRAPEYSAVDAYRSFFTQNAVIMRVEVQNNAVPLEYLKFTTLPNYAGVNFSAASDFQLSAGAFSKSPSKGKVKISLENYPYKWLPLPENTSRVEFSGQNAYAQTMNLFYSPSSSSIFDESYLQNAAYEVDYNTPETADEQMSGRQNINLPPENQAPAFYQLMRTRSSNNHENTLQNLKQTIANLMHYSYLSRSLTAPEVRGNGEFSWLPTADYVFVPSMTGHNIGHIDKNIFAPLLNIPPNCKIDDSYSPCALAFGDEEQFTVASALIARYLGFNSRITVGAKVPKNGVVCTSDVAIWLEVQTADEKWTPIHIAPRIDNALPPKILESSPQSFVTQIARKMPDFHSRGTASPQTNLEKKTEDAQNISPNNAFAIKILRRIGIAFFCLVAFTALIGAIPVAKLARRKLRRKLSGDQECAVGAWHELTDLLCSAGQKYPVRTSTRQEYAQKAEQTAVREVAELVDQAVFSPSNPNANFSADCWKAVDKLTAELFQNANLKAKLKLLYSIRRRRG
jgi:hypothetical protein